MAEPAYDIAIIGGGMAGAMLAVTLLQQQSALQIAIVDPVAPTESVHPSFDSRVIALSQHSIELLKAWSLWFELQSVCEPITEIEVSQQGQFGTAELSAQASPYGAVVEVQQLGAVLSKRLLKHTAVQWFCPDQLTRIEQRQDQVSLQLASGQTIQAQLVVAADGGSSWLREQLHIPLHTQAFNQAALIANLGTTVPHCGRAYERFTADGPMALLPMTEQRLNLVWCMAPAQAEQMRQCSESEFLFRLQRVAGARLGSITQLGQRVVYPLQLVQATQLFHHRIAFIGNAAHQLHPVAGQGFNLAMRDIETLSRLIGAMPVTKLGRYAQLQSYQQQRRADIERVVTATCGLNHIFANRDPLLTLGRTLGLNLLAHWPEAKRQVAALGMGRQPSRLL